MGMAPYGEPRFVDELSRVLRTYADGSFWLDLDYFSFHYSTRRAWTDKVTQLLGTGPRKRDEPFEPGEERSQRYADIAASVQEATERAIVNLARAAHQRTGSTNLCFAGGVALNAMANRRILEETGIEELFVPPAPGDSGAALGAALYVEHVQLGRKERVSLQHAYWGSRYSAAEIAAALEAAEGVEYRELPDEAAVLAETVDALAAGEVVGWFQGRFEFGPRALGNRSILADPRRAEMKERLTEKIKFREPFGTARLQTVREEWKARFFRLLAGWGERSGMPVLLNTSFNLRGEPIVASPQDALRTFGRSGLDLLVLENFVVRKVAP